MPTLTIDEARRKLVKGEAILAQQRANGNVDERVVRAVAALRRAVGGEVSFPTLSPRGEASHVYSHRDEDAPGPVVRKQMMDKDWRVVAVRWVSGVVGEMWTVLDRQTAMQCGRIRSDGLPVYYLDTGEFDWPGGMREDREERADFFRKMFCVEQIQ